MRRLITAGALALLVAIPAHSSIAASRKCLGRNVTIHGTPEDNIIPTSDGSDVVKAGRGDDMVLPSAGQDFFCGNRGDDHLFGGSGNDHAAGGRGDDACDAEHEQGCESEPLMTRLLRGWETAAQ